jgi:hypothetical protein
VPTFANRGVSHGQRGRSPTVVNFSFLDRLYIPMFTTYKMVTPLYSYKIKYFINLNEVISVHIKDCKLYGMHSSDVKIDLMGHNIDTIQI